MRLDHWDQAGSNESMDLESIDDAAADWQATPELYDSNSDTSMCDDDDADDASMEAPSADEISALMCRLAGAPESSSLPEDREVGTGDLVRGGCAEGAATPAAENPPREFVPQAQPSQGEADATIESLDDELREAFLDDASSCVGAIEQALLRLENDPHDYDAVGEICRHLHTLKGASASVGLTRLADQLHGLEDTLREDEQAKRTPDIPALLSHVDSVRDQISGPQQGSEPAMADADSTTLSVPSRTTPAPRFDDGQDDDESVRVKASQLNRLMDMLAQLVMLRNRRDTELADLQGIYRELVGSAAKMRLLSHETDPQAAECSSLQLSEVANDVLEIAAQVRDCGQPIADGNEAVSHFIRDFRRELVELRRTPIGGLFRRLQRVVRDAADAEHKQVQLKLIGHEAGVERSLQQRLYEPLLHIIRNSVCHGIETPERRQQLGKTPKGVISLEAKSGPDLFMIEISDDGGGLDYDAIRRRGIEAGLLGPGQAVSEQELSQLIFKPGFSTRAEADQVAGRGVGMDVVASTLRRMRGWLEVESEQGRGTRIRLSFPLPSVIQHAMVFRAGGQLFAVPMQSIHTTGDAKGGGTCLSITELVNGEASRPEEGNQQIVITGENSIADSADPSDRTQRVILAVDEIVGPEELVVRGLPPLLKNHPYICGATLSGMGETVLFLDPRSLAHLLPQSTASGDSRTHLPDDTDSFPRRSPAAPRVLVVDDSISARKRVVRSLRRYAVLIDEACDGKDALAMLKRQRYDAVLSDMEMPHVSGMELLADVNAAGKQDPPPVVIISSRAEAEFTDRARELGANNYLIKPLADEALDIAIQSIPTLCHLNPNETQPRAPAQLAQTNNPLPGISPLQAAQTRTLPCR